MSETRFTKVKVDNFPQIIAFFFLFFLIVSPYSCHPNPCHHGGGCTKTKSLVFCTCPADYKGHNCESK